MCVPEVFDTETLVRQTFRCITRVALAGRVDGIIAAALIGCHGFILHACVGEIGADVDIFSMSAPTSLLLELCLPVGIGPRHHVLRVLQPHLVRIQIRVVVEHIQLAIENFVGQRIHIDLGV